MKINKLLFFLLALVSLSSCVEYVDNGTKPDGPQTPETQNFTAKHKNPTTATKVGDVFEFESMLNNVDVTTSTKFKVNGVEVNGSKYTPHKEGAHAVIATYNNLTANFKFNVEAKEAEPEPAAGNRIEYNSTSYPVTNTVWILHVKDGKIVSFKDDKTGEIYTLWAMVSYSLDANDDIYNLFQTFQYVSADNSTLKFPFNATKRQALEGGSVATNGTPAFTVKTSNYTFASSGNTEATQANNQYIGQGNYEGTASPASGANAKLFWKGDYNYQQADLMGNKSAKQIMKSAKPLNNTNILKLK